MRIKDIRAAIIKDSRAEDTLEVFLKTDTFEVKASVPSGKSKGDYEAKPLEPKNAIRAIEKTRQVFYDEPNLEPENIDKLLISLKERIGANGTLALSCVFWRAAAKDKNLELYEYIAQKLNKKPRPPKFLLFNLINGGLHAQNSLPFQEYLLLPNKNSSSESLDFCFKFLDKLKGKVDQFDAGSMGDEGGFTINADDAELGFKIFKDILNEDFKIEDAFFGVDAAAGAFFKESHYKLGKRILLPRILADYYQDLEKKYPILYIEDPFQEDAFEDFAFLKRRVGAKVWIVGDDLTATNSKRIKKSNELSAINGVIIKPNQIGTVSETIEAATLAQSYNWKIIVSHRSGETTDDFIADLAVGINADGLKAGSPLQAERLVKYKRLITIEEKLGIMIR